MCNILVFVTTRKKRTKRNYLYDEKFRYINIPTWPRGFQDNLLYMVLFFYSSLFWELRDKRNLKHLQF